jgi:hypothetical protein
MKGWWHDAERGTTQAGEAAHIQEWIRLLLRNAKNRED